MAEDLVTPQDILDATEDKASLKAIDDDAFDELMLAFADAINNKLARRNEAVPADADYNLGGNDLIAVNDIIGSDENGDVHWRFHWDDVNQDLIMQYNTNTPDNPSWDDVITYEVDSKNIIFNFNNKLQFEDGSQIHSDHFNSNGEVNNYKSNDIDSDGDGVVDKADDSEAFDGLQAEDGNQGQVLQTDGTEDGLSWGAGSKKEVFTSDGTFNVPSGISEVVVTAVGGGGGGSDGVDSGGSNGAQGGTSGQVVKDNVSVTGGNGISITVGSGGSGGGSKGDGADGGNTSFGNKLIALGGDGGTAGKTGPNVPSYYSDGYLTPDEKWGAGTGGSNSHQKGSSGPAGGSNIFGTGGKGYDSDGENPAAGDGSGHGSGGGASSHGVFGGGDTTGDGADGIVIVQW